MKKIVILSMSERASQLYIQSIRKVFNSYDISIEPYIIDDANVFNIPKDADLYLGGVGNIENNIASNMTEKFDLPLGIPVVDMIVEFTKDDVKPLLSIPKGENCLFVNTSDMLSMECITDLHNTMGIYHIDFYPYSGGEIPYDIDFKTAVTAGEPQLVPNSIETVIDLGVRSICPETMAEIAFILHIENVLDTSAYKDYAEMFANSSSKLNLLIQRYTYYKNSLDMVIEKLGEGVIGINEEYKIFCANDKAADIIKSKDAEHLLGEDARIKLPFIDWQTQEFSESSFVSDYNGTKLNITLNPILRSGIVKGIILLVQKFYEQETKQNKARLQLLDRGYLAKYTFNDIIGSSNAILSTIDLAKKMALSESTILITGETGTGKELLASAIHNYSCRRDHPYIAINCSAMSDNLLESELFGYDEGAFTGAKKNGKLGLFEYAHCGTLFLDEIEDMSSALQLKLLRVLQEREIMHIGGDRVIKVDVRIIAATNQNLESLVECGKIRRDLYYRLNTLQVEVPPLRNRRSDIMPLFDYFIKKHGANLTFSGDAVSALMRHSWPGNVRELENYVEYLSCLQKNIINFTDLPTSVQKTPTETDEFKFVLELLYTNYNNHIRTGRKTIVVAAEKSGIFLTEQQTRGLLAKMAERGFVSISKGRSGSQITEKGIDYYKSISI